MLKTLPQLSKPVKSRCLPAKKILHQVLLPFILLNASYGFGQSTHHVPADYNSIQSAINASVNGDTVIVAPGIYFENINFKGKKIVVTSNFYLNGDTSFINQTVINGSKPASADTGSCVIFSHHEDTSAVIMGFTITGGTGTVWLDAFGAGTYREGGGILIDVSSPTIRYNKIVYNKATNSTGLSGAGGGGIRISDSNPHIYNNFIAHNQGLYGPGIVLNYTGCVIRNNIIAYNTGGSTFNGGGAIWSYEGNASPEIIENNTIYGNHATIGTGGCLVQNTTFILRNNIIWGNKSPDNSQIKTVQGTATVSNCDVEGGYTGTGNLKVSPSFLDTTAFILSPSSSCIDRGDPSPVYNDAEDADNPGNPKLPARGTLQNDIGAYGGPLETLITQGAFTTGIHDFLKNDFSIHVFPNPAHEAFSVHYILPATAFVGMNQVNLLGEKKELLYSELQSEGPHTIFFQHERETGMYLMELKVNDEIAYSKFFVQ